MKDKSRMKSKDRLCMVVLFAIANMAPLCWAQSLSEAVESSRSRVEEAKKQLAELRAKIETETLPLSKQLSQMEMDVAGRRAMSQDVDRTLSTKQLENTNLQSAVKLKTEENAYLASILDEFVRGFETRLFSGEAPRYKPIVEEAKLAMGNQDLGSSDKFARQIAAVKAATARLQEIVGGARYPGRAVDLKGNLISGTFAIIGPAAFFASEFGDVTGLAIQQATSPNPLIRPIPLEGEMGEPHEKFLHWASGLFSKGAHEGRSGVKELVAGTEGWMALDPSRGAALAGLVKKFNVIETFIHGGWIMWPILLASIAAFAVVFERIFFMFNESRKRSPRKQALFFAACEKQDMDEAIKISKSTKDFVVKALGYALEHRDTSLHGALVYSSQSALKKFTRGLVVLDTVITLAPMLGLLGTVTGMMGSFESISGDNGNPTAVMGGISEALIATAAGLGIALVCLLPYNYLNAKIEEAQKDLEVASARLELLIQVAEQVAQVRKRLEEDPPSGRNSGRKIPNDSENLSFQEREVGGNRRLPPHDSEGDLPFGEAVPG
jgi:biopolymer transport protein ExbB